MSVLHQVKVGRRVKVKDTHPLGTIQETQRVGGELTSFVAKWPGYSKRFTDMTVVERTESKS